MAGGGVGWNLAVKCTLLLPSGNRNGGEAGCTGKDETEFILITGNFQTEWELQRRPKSPQGDPPQRPCLRIPSPDTG